MAHYNLIRNILILIFSLSSLFSFTQTQVGKTTYDLQTNRSVARRVATNPAGEIVVTYTRSNFLNQNFIDRGTGYNFSSDSGLNWSETNFNLPFNRPDSVKTGWPNIVYTQNKEVIVSHYGSGLQVLKRDLGTTNPWDKQLLNASNVTNFANSNYMNSATWSRAANKGDSIFVIFGLSGSDLPGMSGGLLMYRSFDAGITWSGPDDIPFVNFLNFKRIEGDDFALDVSKNGKIALVLGSYQVEVLTSTDWGTTFQKQTVVAAKDISGNLFPLFDGLQGETLDTINSSDRSYSVVVDDNDKVHIWFGRNLVSKVETTSIGTNYEPLEVGIMYWNNNMTEASIIHQSKFAAQQIGLNTPLFSNQIFSSMGFGKQLELYRNQLVSMPSGAFDENGNIYVSYSAVKPATFDNITDFTSTNNLNADGYHFQDIYLLKSSDNGQTWQGPINISDEPLKECVYPSIPRKIYGNSIPLIWQQDTIPGNSLQVPFGVVHPVVENQIMFKNIPILSIVTPTDITAPTLEQNVLGANTVSGFINCPIDFSVIFNNEDVPDGINSLAYQLVDSSNIVSQGIHNVEVFVEDAAGFSSDTLSAVINILADNTPPIVNLIGANNLDVIINSTYVDLGITYSDNACLHNIQVEDSTDLVLNTLGNYSYYWSVTDNNGNVTTVSRIVNVINQDTTAPVIFAKGIINDTIETCTAWIDSGLTAFDNIDYDVSSSVVTTHNINTQVSGFYSINDTVIDAAGNIGFLNRTLAVIDTQKPVIDILFSTNNLYICKGDVFIAPNANATDCELSLLSSNENTINTNISGTQTLIYTATDLSGNTATDSLQIHIGEAPIPNFDYTNIGNAISVTDLSLNNPTIWDWDWGDNTNHNYSPTTTHAYISEGIYVVTLMVSNKFTAACNTPLSAQIITKNVIVDITPPVINIVGDTFKICNGSSFSPPIATATDNFTNSPTITNNQNIVNENMNGIYNLKYTAVDDNNNSSSKTIAVIVGQAPIPDFIFSFIDDSTILVEDISVNYPTTRIWDWGDGSSYDSLQYESHSYENGLYQLKLTVENEFSDICNVSENEKSLSKSINIVGLSNIEEEVYKITVFPNPTNRYLNIYLSENNFEFVNLKLYNVTGDLVKEQIVSNRKLINNFKFDLRNESKGVYLLEVKTKTNNFTKKILLK